MNISRYNDLLIDVLNSTNYSNGRNIFVLNEKDILVGVVSQGDLVKLLSKKINISSIKISDIMNLNPISITEKAEVDMKKIIETMINSKINEIPVISVEGKIIKILSIYKILESQI